ncbi:uncharacterized protein LOC144383566 [Gasterosteus aculeatus]
MKNQSLIAEREHTKATEHLSTTNNEATGKISQLKIKSETQSELIVVSQREIDHLQSEISSLRENEDISKEHLKEAERKLAEKSNMNDDLHRQNAKIETDFEELSRINADLKQSEEEAHQRNDENLAQLKDLNEKLDRTIKYHSAFALLSEKREDALINENKVLGDKLTCVTSEKDLNQTKISNLEAVVEALVEENQTMKNQSLIAEREHTKATEHLSTTNNEAKSKISQLKIKLEEQSELFVVSQREIDHLQSEISSLRENEDISKEHLKEAERKLAEKSNMNDDLHRQNAQIETEIEELWRINAAHKQSEEEAHQRNHENLAQLKDLNEKLDRKTKYHSDFVLECEKREDALINKNKVLGDKLACVRSEKVLNQAKISNLEADVKELVEENRTMKNQSLIAEREHTKVTEHLDDLQKKVETCYRTISEKDEEMQLLKQTNDRYLSEIQQFRPQEMQVVGNNNLREEFRIYAQNTESSENHSDESLPVTDQTEETPEDEKVETSEEMRQETHEVQTEEMRQETHEVQTDETPENQTEETPMDETQETPIQARSWWSGLAKGVVYVGCNIAISIATSLLHGQLFPNSCSSDLNYSQSNCLNDFQCFTPRPF